MDKLENTLVILAMYSVTWEALFEMHRQWYISQEVT